MIEPRVVELLQSEYDNDRSYVLSWAYNTLSPKDLIDFFVVAVRYRVYMNRTDLEILEKIGRRVSQLRPNLSYHASVYPRFDAAPMGSYSGYYDDYGRELGKDPLDMDLDHPDFFKFDINSTPSHDPFESGGGSSGLDITDAPLPDFNMPGVSPGTTTKTPGFDTKSLFDMLGKLGTAGVDLALKWKQGDQAAANQAALLQAQIQANALKMQAMGLSASVAMQRAQAEAAAKLVSSKETNTMLYLGAGLLALYLFMQSQKK